jgi:two-component system sensor histidine kinase CiaH
MKRRSIFNHTNIPSIRLALSYLGIIMVLSVGFSVIFYRTSTISLGGQSLIIQTPSMGSSGSHTLQPPPPVESVSIGSDAKPTPITANNISALNAQLQKRVSSIRSDLLRRLIMLNAAALVFGAALSYYLARRTLQPIEAAMDAQTRFSSDASHELRTPLTALRARNEVALRKSTLTLTEAKEIIRNSIDQTIKLERLSDGLLRLSRDNHRGLEKKSISLEEIANTAMNGIIESAQAKGIAVDEAVPDIKVVGDTQGLLQAVTILLENAIKYSENASVIHITGSVEGKHGLLSVQDEGLGIRAVDLPHIFERFYRADHARTKHGEYGYGLGLSIADKLVAQNEGEITVESTIGEGSTFTIRLPLARL